VHFLDTTLGRFILGDDEGDESEPNVDVERSSYFIDCIFEDLSGELSSAVSIYESRVTFLSAGDAGEVVQFKNNVSNLGSTLYSVNSVVLFRNITSAGNTAVRGGCI